jgi:hypothetical protein
LFFGEINVLQSIIKQIVERFLGHHILLFAFALETDRCNRMIERALQRQVPHKFGTFGAFV